MCVCACVRACLCVSHTKELERGRLAVPYTLYLGRGACIHPQIHARREGERDWQTGKPERGGWGGGLGGEGVQREHRSVVGLHSPAIEEANCKVVHAPRVD